MAHAERVLQQVRWQMLDQLDGGDGVEGLDLLGQLLERAGVERAVRGSIDLARVVDLRLGDVDADRLVLVAQHAEERPRAAADVEHAAAPGDQPGDPLELEVMPLALNAPAPPKDPVVVPRRNRRVVERWRRWRHPAASG